MSILFAYWQISTSRSSMSGDTLSPTPPTHSLKSGTWHPVMENITSLNYVRKKTFDRFFLKTQIRLTHWVAVDHKGLCRSPECPGGHAHPIYPQSS